MTYLVGMVASDGVIIASDGLTKLSYPGKPVHEVIDEDKVHEVQGHLVAVAGNIVPDNLIPALKVAMPYFSLDTPQKAAETIAGFVFSFWRSTIQQQDIQGALEIIIAGYTDKPYLYYAHSAKPDTLSSCTNISAGYWDTVAPIVKSEYSKSAKSWIDVTDIATRAVTRASEDYPNDVGGSIFLHKLTKDTMTMEKISMADKDKFENLVKLVSQPLQPAADKLPQSDDYSDKQTRSRKAGDTSVKSSDTSRPSNASSDPKTPR